MKDILQSLAIVIGVAVGAILPSDGGASEDLISLRLLPGWMTDDGTRMAGIEVTLQPGWKTYWRKPGEAGIPPEFSFAGSENVAATEIHWPAPNVFHSFDMETLGYTRSFVLPVEVTPQRTGAAMTLRGRAALGVCRDICVPVTASFLVTLPPETSGSGDRDRIEAALGRGPVALSRGVAVPCRVTPIADGMQVAVWVPPEAGPSITAVIIELPRNDVWVSEADLRRDGDAMVAVADMVPPDAKPFAVDRSTLRLTMVGDGRAVTTEGCQGR